MAASEPWLIDAITGLHTAASSLYMVYHLNRIGAWLAWLHHVVVNSDCRTGRESCHESAARHGVVVEEAGVFRKRRGLAQGLSRRIGSGTVMMRKLLFAFQAMSPSS